MINRDSYKSLLESVQEAVAPVAPAKVAPTKETEQQVDSVEEWDEIDEILAEGIEMYGEEGFTTILTHFAETGEMSKELSDLLG